MEVPLYLFVFFLFFSPFSNRFWNLIEKHNVPDNHNNIIIVRDMPRVRSDFSE